MEPQEEYIIDSATVMKILETGVNSGIRRISEPILSELQSARSSNDYFWAGDVHSVSYTIGSDHCLAQFCPYFEGTIVDVLFKGGSSNWTSTLKVSESVTVNKVVQDIENVFKLNNITAKMAADVNTEFTSANADGRFIKGASCIIQV